MRSEVENQVTDSQIGVGLDVLKHLFRGPTEAAAGAPGGDTGGGEVTLTYNYSNFNNLIVSHLFWA